VCDLLIVEVSPFNGGFLTLSLPLMTAYMKVVIKVIGQKMYPRNFSQGWN